MSAPDREFLVVYGADGDNISPLSHLASTMWGAMAWITLCDLPAWASGTRPDRLPLCPDCQTIALGGAA